MRKLFLTMAVSAALLTTSARAEVTDCQEILSVPVTISTQGVHCFKSDKVSSATSGNLIDIQANNVTIDLNGFKLGGSGAGLTTTAIGIFADNRKNITIRNGTIRGFATGVFLTSQGHLLEDLLLDQNRKIGAQIKGSGHVIRNNRVVNTGSGGTVSGTFGIFLDFASTTVVADNVVSGTLATTLARGIFVIDSALIEVRGNTILDVKGATFKRGIEIDDSAHVTVIDNRILNAAGTGTQGIIGLNGSTGINCLDNIIDGYTVAVSGCDVDLRNDKL